jgi:hypothetical protein
MKNSGEITGARNPATLSRSQYKYRDKMERFGAYREIGSKMVNTMRGIAGSAAAIVIVCSAEDVCLNWRGMGGFLIAAG